MQCSARGSALDLIDTTDNTRTVKRHLLGSFYLHEFQSLIRGPALIQRKHCYIFGGDF